MRQGSNVSDVVSRYGSAADFLQTFAIQNQMRYTENAARCVMGSAPTLLQVEGAYGRKVVDEWLTYQLANLSEYFGGAGKITIGQMDDLCALMIQECKGHRITALMLFFRRVKAGYYGKFFGAFDPMALMEMWRKFCTDVGEIIAQEERRRQVERLDEFKRDAVPLEVIRERMEKGEYQNLKRFFDGEGDYGLLRDQRQGDDRKD